MSVSNFKTVTKEVGAGKEEEPEQRTGTHIIRAETKNDNNRLQYGLSSRSLDCYFKTSESSFYLNRRLRHTKGSAKVV